MSHHQYEKIMNAIYQRNQMCQEQALPVLREALLQEAKNAQERVILQELFPLYQIYAKKQLLIAMDRFKEFIKLNFESHFYSANHYCGMRDRRQKLTDMFICKAMNTFKHPNCQEKIQKIFESFKTRVYVSRMVQYYKFKSTVPIFQTWIDFNNVFKIIANQYHLNIEFTGQFQYKGDLTLLSSLLQGIIILMRENNQLTCIITQEVNQVFISIKRQERLRNLQKIKKTQLFVNLNFLVRQLGFAEISLYDNSLEFCIMKDSFFSYQ